jgi:hypothetical protein
MRNRSWGFVAGLLLSALLGAPLAAQGTIGRGYLFREPPVAITVFGGVAQPSAGGDLWAFTFDELTLDRGAFGGVERGGDFAVRLSPRLDLVLSYAAHDVRRRSESRDFIGTDSLPIAQTTRLIRRPFGAAVRYHLRDRGRMLGTRAWVPNRVVPFVGFGLGRMAYSLDQQGEFVDETTLAIFADRYRAAGRTAFAQVSAGAAWTLIPSVAVTGEVRYLSAGADGSPSFTGFDRLDLSGLSANVGLTLRVF